MHNPNNNKIMYDKNELQGNGGLEFVYNTNEDNNRLFFNYKYATNLSQDMYPAEDIKEDIPLANIEELMKNNFYNEKL